MFMFIFVLSRIINGGDEVAKEVFITRNGKAIILAEPKLFLRLLQQHLMIHK